VTTPWPGDTRPLWVRARALRAQEAAAAKAAPRIGRPPIPEEERRESLLSVRFTDGERAQLEEIAAANGITLSDWARRVLLKAKRKDRP